MWSSLRDEDGLQMLCRHLVVMLQNWTYCMANQSPTSKTTWIWQVPVGFCNLALNNCRYFGRSSPKTTMWEHEWLDWVMPKFMLVSGCGLKCWDLLFRPRPAALGFLVAPRWFCVVLEGQCWSHYRDIHQLASIQGMPCYTAFFLYNRSI